MDFNERLRCAKSEGQNRQQQREALAREQQERLQQSEERCRTARQTILDHAKDCLKDFMKLFPEFGPQVDLEGNLLCVSYETLVHKPDGKLQKLFSRISLEVRIYPEYSDVEVISKRCVYDKNESLRVREEDVYTGDIDRLHRFVENEILLFTKDYGSLPE